MGKTRTMVILLLIFLQIFASAYGQEITLESTLISCHYNGEEFEGHHLKNPIRLAITSKGKESGDSEFSRAYSKCRKLLLITFRIGESVKDFISDGLVVVDHGVNKLTGKPSKFMAPLAVKFHQDKLVQSYSLKYLYRVNGKMWEEVINHENSHNYTGCVDSSASPTCGFITGGEDKSKKEVAGFCCSCQEDHSNNVQQRGGQRCDTPGIEPKLLTSAHCLRSGPFFYNVYEVGLPTLYQKISFEVFKSEEKEDGSLKWEKLSDKKDGIVVDTIRPVSASGNVKVGYRPHMQVIDSSSILLRPEDHPRLLYPIPNPFVSPEAQPEPLKGAIEDQVLVIPKFLMAPHGAKCDHVGTGAAAFLNQENPCRLARDSCLKNQPFDLWMQDQGPQGAQGQKYRLKSFLSSSYTPPIIEFAEDMKTGSLFVEDKSPSQTYVDIEITADDIFLISPGYNALIESVLIDTSLDGSKIIVQVLNREYVAASFAVQLEHCGGMNQTGIYSSAPQQKIVPLGSAYYDIDFHPFQTTQMIYCFVVLVNEFGEKVAAREVPLKPEETCLCVHNCKCACGGDGDNLKCDALSNENMIAAGLFDEVKSSEMGGLEGTNRNTATIVFHLMLWFHIILIFLCVCLYTHKRFFGWKKLIKNDKYGQLEDEEEEDEEEDDNASRTTEASDVTLYKRPGVDSTSVPELIDQIRIRSTESSKVQFENDKEDEEQTKESRGSLRSKGETDVNPFDKMSKENVDDDFEELNKKWGEGGTPERKNSDGGAYFRNANSNDDFDKDNNLAAAETDAYLMLMSASSSKTSFGTWSRRKREQFTAYDFLPTPKRKESV